MLSERILCGLGQAQALVRRLDGLVESADCRVCGGEQLERLIIEAVQGGERVAEFLAERDGLIAGGYGYRYEGEGFRALAEATDGAMAIHRFFNGEAGGHLYTTSEAMKTELVGEGYVYEGILGYVFA